MFWYTRESVAFESRKIGVRIAKDVNHEKPMETATDGHRHISQWQLSLVTLIVTL